MKRSTKRSTAARAAARRGLEALEDRRLFSAAILAGGVLTLKGDAAQNNTFYVQPASGNRVIGYVDNKGQTADTGTLQQIVVKTGTGADKVTVADSMSMAVKVIAPDGTTSLVQPGQSITFGSGSAGSTNDNGSNNDGSTDNGSTNNGGGTTSNDPRAPQAAITITDGATLYPGQSVHVEALDSSFGSGDPLNSRIVWNFGDGGSSHNEMVGFNVAHAYDKPGSYTVSLTITNPDGLVSTTTQQVNVLRDTRPTIYVSASGNDNNDGLSQNSPVQSIDRVNQLLTSNTRVLFHDGDTFNTTTGINIQGLHDVTIASYGQGSQPTLMYNGAAGYGQIINVLPGSERIVIQGLTMDTIFTDSFNDQAIPAAIHVNGSNITIRGNTFLNVLEDVAMESAPKNVLIQDNASPNPRGLRAYFAWVQGSDITIVGNTVANSTREHIVRVAGATRVEIADNTLSNISGAAWGDSEDGVKGAITIQYGSYAYVVGNTILSGPITVGPLTITDPGPQSSSSAVFNECVLEGNTFNDGVLFQPGAINTMVRNNVVNQSGNPAFYINAQESLYGRQVQNLFFLNNTVIDSGVTGGFLKIGAGQARNIVVDHNLFIAPNMVIGNDQALIYVSDTSLQSFTEIKDNIWPVPQTYNWVQGGYFYVAPAPGVQSGYLTPTQWEQTGVAGGDVYANVALSSGFGATIEGITAGSNLALAA